MVIGISNEPMEVIENFIEDQGITFPVLHDVSGVYQQYNIPGGESPYPRDYVIDADGIFQLVRTEYEPGVIISVVEDLLDITTEIKETHPLVSTMRPVLISNYPNPFNPESNITLSLNDSYEVSVSVYDINGRHVDTLFAAGILQAGEHRFRWQPDNLPSGVYLLKVSAGKHLETRRILLSR